MKKFVSIFFGGIALLYLIGFAFQFSIAVDYQMNKEKVIKEFCVNKDKPEMECNGKCHLAKELNKIPLVDLKIRTEKQDKPEVQIIEFDTCDELIYCNSIDTKEDESPNFYDIMDTYCIEYVDTLLDPPEDWS